MAFQRAMVVRSLCAFLFASVCVNMHMDFHGHFLFARTSTDACVPVLSKGVLKRPFLQPLNAISPVGGGHTAVGVQQDPETPYY